jgi:2-C-methyl-D-erythritol 4-phosphate cytidylyltransferase
MKSGSRSSCERSFLPADRIGEARMPRVYAVIAAAGSGTRFGGDMPKQYAPLAGRPVIVHSIERVADALRCEALVVAVGADDREYAACVGDRDGVTVERCGGATRAETVRNALVALSPRCVADDWIIVHDAVRPCVPRAAIVRLAQALVDDQVGGLLALPVSDTLKRAAVDGSALPRSARTESRDGLWQAQTPQMFRYGVLADALALDAALAWTDEAQAIEALADRDGCARPRLVEGSPYNIKITYAQDLALAEAILASERDT